MANENKAFEVGGLSGLVVGMSAILVLNSLIPLNFKSKIFPAEDGRPAVMRTYRNLGRDAISVQDKTGTYIPLGEYLSQIQGEADRGIEEIRIRKAVGWYSE